MATAEKTVETRCVQRCPKQKGNKTMNMKLLKIFGIVLGLLAIVLGIMVFSQSVGYYEGNSTYGGDAYTGIQNAAAQTANNIKYVGEMIRFALGSLLLVLGLAMLLGSLCIRTSKKAAASLPQTAPAQAPAYPTPQVVVPCYQSAGWNCPQCGTPNEPDSRFCQGCGTAKS